jgi:hypothetical protein
VPIAVSSALRHARERAVVFGCGVPRGRRFRPRSRCLGRSPDCRFPPSVPVRPGEPSQRGRWWGPTRSRGGRVTRTRSSVGGCLHRRGATWRLPIRYSRAMPAHCTGQEVSQGRSPFVHRVALAVRLGCPGLLASTRWCSPFRSEFQRSALSSRFRRGLPRPTTNEVKIQEDPRQTSKHST